MIQPLERIEVINKRLTDYYGYFELIYPKFRVVFSDDQYETKMIKESPEGLRLLSPVKCTMLKYNYIKAKYVLEKITPVPEYLVDDIGQRVSYEPVWVFEDHLGNALPPKWEAIEAIFKSIQMAMEKKDPYKQDEKAGNTTEALEYQCDKLQEQLFGNETSLTDALAVGEAVGYGSTNRDDTRFNNNVIKL